jgi:hypothetical protein
MQQRCNIQVNRMIKIVQRRGHSAVKFTTLNHENHTWADHFIKLNHIQISNALRNSENIDD